VAWLTGLPLPVLVWGRLTQLVLRALRAPASYYR
jgi:hypothetical protein